VYLIIGHISLQLVMTSHADAAPGYADEVWLV
jgi:hypothetical protein